MSTWEDTFNYLTTSAKNVDKSLVDIVTEKLILFPMFSVECSCKKSFDISSLLHTSYRCPHCKEDYPPSSLRVNGIMNQQITEFILSQIPNLLEKEQTIYQQRIEEFKFINLTTYNVILVIKLFQLLSRAQTAPAISSKVSLKLSEIFITNFKPEDSKRIDLLLLQQFTRNELFFFFNVLQQRNEKWFFKMFSNSFLYNSFFPHSDNFQENVNNVIHINSNNNNDNNNNNNIDHNDQNNSNVILNFENNLTKNLNPFVNNINHNNVDIQNENNIEEEDEFDDSSSFEDLIFIGETTKGSSEEDNNVLKDRRPREPYQWANQTTYPYNKSPFFQSFEKNHHTEKRKKKEEIIYHYPPSDQQVYVFIDNSNVMIGARNRGIKLCPRKLSMRIERNRKRVKGFACGSGFSVIFDKWRKIGYEIYHYENEAFVDSRLHLMISLQIIEVQRTLREQVDKDEKPVFIFATGDGNNHDGHSSFPHMVELALSCGYVEVWSWKESLNNVFYKFMHDSNFSIYYFDDYLKEIRYNPP